MKRILFLLFSFALVLFTELGAVPISDAAASVSSPSTSTSVDSLSSSVTSLSSILGAGNANKNANNPNAVAVWPWFTFAAVLVKLCIITKWVAIFGWGLIMNYLGFGTRDFHKKYFLLTTTTEVPTTMIPAMMYGGHDAYGAPYG